MHRCRPLLSSASPGPPPATAYDPPSQALPGAISSSVHALCGIRCRSQAPIDVTAAESGRHLVSLRISAEGMSTSVDITLEQSFCLHVCYISWTQI